LLTDGAELVAVPGDARVAHRAPELVVARLDLGQPAAELGGELGHAAASPASASSSDAIATSIIGSSGRRVVIAWRSRPGAMARRMSGLSSCPAPRRSTSYEIEATGITRTRRTTRSTMRFTRGRKAKTAIAMTTTNSRNAVPHRGCAVGYGATWTASSGAPCSKAWIVMCSAPWYANTRRVSGTKEVATRDPSRSGGG